LVIGAAEISKGLVSAAEYGRQADARSAASAAGKTGDDRSDSRSAPSESRPRTTDGTATGNGAAQNYVARIADRDPVATVNRTATAPATSIEVQNKTNVTQNERAVAAQVAQEQVTVQRVGDKDKGVAPTEVRATAAAGSNQTFSQAFFSVPLTAQEIRSDNRRKYGGLDVGYVYYAKGPGGAPVEDTRPIPLATTTSLFSTNINDIPDRERVTNVRFDWKRTRLDPSALSKPEGFYMSTQYGTDARGGMGRGGGTTKRDENGSGAGTFAKKYAFLAASAEQAKGHGGGNPQVAPGTEDAEAINPDNAVAAQNAGPNPATVAYNDPNMVTSSVQQDDEQPVALT
jgi:hypothetical protein